MGTIEGTPVRRRSARVLIALVLGLVAAVVGASPALAHDYLVGSSPAAGSTVTSALSRVTLTFDAAVLGTGNGSTVVAVTGPGGKHFESACPVVKNDDVSTAVRLGGAGTYTVTWRIVSADGHPVADSIHFRYAPKAGAAAAGSTNGPSCGDAASRTGSAAAAGTSSSEVLVLVAVVVGVLVVLVVVVVVLAVVLTRRRG